MSLTSCNLRDYSVSSSSLKSLKITLRTCEEIEVAAKNLESFKFVSSTSDQRCIAKHVTIRAAKHLRNFVIWAGQDNVEATIIIPNISLSFSGFLKASAWAGKLWEASITLPDIELPTFDSSLDHLSSLRDYLESFDCSRKITLKVHDATVYKHNMMGLITFEFLYLLPFSKFCNESFRSQIFVCVRGLGSLLSKEI